MSTRKRKPTALEVTAAEVADLAARAVSNDDDDTDDQQRALLTLLYTLYQADAVTAHNLLLDALRAVLTNATELTEEVIAVYVATRIGPKKGGASNG